MARRRKTGGRTKGTPNKATAAQAAAIAASGLTPLYYMLAVMRDESVTPEMRLEAAAKAAPYVHPRLAATETKINFGPKRPEELSDEEIASRIQELGGLLKKSHS